MPNISLRAISVITVTAVLTLGQAAVSQAATTTLGNLTGVSQQGSTVTLTAGSDQVRVSFFQPDVFRLWLGPGGSFSDPVGGAILTGTNFGPVPVNVTDAGSYQKLETSSVVLRANKTPLRFALYKKDNSTLI